MIKAILCFACTTYTEVVGNKNEKINKILIFQRFQHNNKISTNFNKFI